MGHPIYQIDNSLNWDLVTRRVLNGVLTPDGKGFLIIPYSVALASRLVLVGCKSSTAKSTWRLGCWARFRLLSSPSSTSEYVSAIEFHSQICLLNRLNLIQVPQVYPWPYLLYLEFPRWLSTIEIEVWNYTGIAEDSTEEILYRIESKLDTLQP